MTQFHLQYAWLGGAGVSNDVLIDVADEHIVDVRSDNPCPSDAVRLHGLTLPGLANAHSHAFHRALRGRTHRGGGSFWTWRDDMYAVAARLDPDNYYALARACYAEMSLAGITNVGEFHYVHHGPDGAPYDDPNAMGEALLSAARDAGIRITLLDSCYLSGGIDTPLEGPQLRFGDADGEAWAGRVAELQPPPSARIGAAIHSVRAVPVDQLSAVVDWSTSQGCPLHFHLSEQRLENERCLARYGATPAEVLAERGALDGLATAVHATHLTDDDVVLLGRHRAFICFTPTTERDLADGIGPARTLADAGTQLCLGSDSNAVIDLFEETRALELDERLRSETRGHWTASALLTAATADGHASLGWPEAGRIAAGSLADFVTVGLDSVRLADAAESTLLEAAVFCATAADVTDVVIAGRRIVERGRHRVVDDVPHELARAVRAVTA